MARHDRSFLEAALLGYETEFQRVTAAIADLQKRLGNVAPGGVPAPMGRAVIRKKHRISAEGRARIAAAQRKRWAARKRQE